MLSSVTVLWSFAARCSHPSAGFEGWQREIEQRRLRWFLPLKWPQEKVVCLLKLPEKFVRASLLLLVSAIARLNCSRMLLSSDERCSVRCSATRRRSFKAWNSLWYAISFSVKKKKEGRKERYVSTWQRPSILTERKAGDILDKLAHHRAQTVQKYCEICHGIFKNLYLYCICKQNKVRLYIRDF